jgi:hypothetical protein
MGQVIIGMDPHKRSATIEVINDCEKILAQGRFGSDHDGYQTMLKLGRQYKDRRDRLGPRRRPAPMSGQGQAPSNQPRSQHAHRPVGPREHGPDVGRVAARAEARRAAARMTHARRQVARVRSGSGAARATIVTGAIGRREPAPVNRSAARF